MAKELTADIKHIAAAALLVVLLLLFTTSASASGISLGVDENLRGKLLITEQRLTPDAPKVFTVEAQNPGSKSFTGRIRLDIQDEQNRTVFRTWSNTLQLTAGSLTAHRFMFYAPEYNGTLTAEAVLHHGTKRISRTVTFNTSLREVEDGFSVRRIRTYDDIVRMRVDAPNDVDSFALTVDDRSTRRFEQKHIENAEGKQVIDVRYHPAVIEEDEATITLSSTDGKYHYTKEVSLQRDPGISTMIVRWLRDMVENLPFT